MIHTVLVAVCSLLGLAVWGRVMFSFASDDFERLRSLWASLPPLGQCWLVFSSVMPAAYYVFCLLCCFSVIPKPSLKSSGYTMHALSIPVFLSLLPKLPTMGQSGLLTAFFWFMMYRDRVRHDSAPQSDAANAG